MYKSRLLKQLAVHLRSPDSILPVLLLWEEEITKVLQNSQEFHKGILLSHNVFHVCNELTNSNSYSPGFKPRHPISLNLALESQSKGVVLHASELLGTQAKAKCGRCEAGEQTRQQCPGFSQCQLVGQSFCPASQLLNTTGRLIINYKCSAHTIGLLLTSCYNLN